MFYNRKKLTRVWTTCIALHCHRGHAIGGCEKNEDSIAHLICLLRGSCIECLDISVRAEGCNIGAGTLERCCKMSSCRVNSATYWKSKAASIFGHSLSFTDSFQPCTRKWSLIFNRLIVLGSWCVSVCFYVGSHMNQPWVSLLIAKRQLPFTFTALKGLAITQDPSLVYLRS